jgi:hypothetical protein
MTACYPAQPGGSRLAAMASSTVQRPRRHREHLFEGPVLFRRRRMQIAELAALAWLVARAARLGQERS